MTDEDEKAILDKYKADFELYGVSDASLGWKKGRAKLRFEILTSEWDLEGKKILDFGCGFGGLYDFLKEKKVYCDYTGVDINPKFIEVAKKKHPGVDFRLINLLKKRIRRKFDYAFVSGTFNDKIGDNIGFISQALKILDIHAMLGIAFNCISNKVEYKEDHVYYADPAKILDLSYKISNCIVLRNDYMPYEFSVIISKNVKKLPGNIAYKKYQYMLS